MWDVTYWTWGCIGAACLFGDRAWWLYLAVPVYSGYLAWTTFFGMKNGLAGLGGAGSEDVSGVGAGTGAASKRQQKLEKRGGRVQYR